MKKKIFAFVIASVMILSMGLTVVAAPFAGWGNRARAVNGLGFCRSGAAAYCTITDEYGNLLDMEAFEVNLDKAISDGLIRAENREYYIERYNYCLYNGAGCVYYGGGRGFGGGCCYY